MKPKHVAICVNSLRKGGIEKSSLDLAVCLHEAGFETTLFTFNATIEIETKNYKNITCINSEKNKDIQSAILERHNTNPIDYIIHTRHSIETPFIPKNFYIIHNVLSERLNKKSILQKIKKKFRHQKELNGKNIICVSNGVKQDLLQNIGIKPKSICVISNPYDAEAIRAAACEEIPDICKPYIVSIGSFNKIKRHDILLEAYALADIPHRLVLVGDGNERNYIERKIAELGITEKVILVGWKKNPYPYIKNASLTIISSDSESLSSVVIESLILRTPVISTDCIGPKEILQSELSAFLSPISNHALLAQNITKAISKYPTIKDEYYLPYNKTTVIEKYKALFSY